MTAFTHEYWRTGERDIWRQRGLHWHCYAWQGDGRSFSEDAARRDPGTELPPTVVREWLGKPSRLIRQSPTTPEDAVAWLRREFERYDPQTGVPAETRWGMALYDLSGGHDISWAFWLSGGSSIASMAVVGIADCPLH